MDKFNRARPRKWIWTFVAFLFFAGAGFGGAKGISLLLGGLFSRSNLDRIAYHYAKNHTMADLAVDEALIVSLDFNSKQPRMFSKYFDKASPGTYSEKAW